MNAFGCASCQNQLGDGIDTGGLTYNDIIAAIQAINPEWVPVINQQVSQACLSSIWSQYGTLILLGGIGLVLFLRK